MSYVDYLALGIVESIDTEEIAKAIKDGIRIQCNIDVETKDIQAQLEAVLIEFVIDILESISYQGYCYTNKVRTKQTSNSRVYSTLDNWNSEEESKEIKKKVIDLDNWTIEEVLGDSNANK